MKKWTVYVYDVIHVCDNGWCLARFYCLFIFLLPLAKQLPRGEGIFLYLSQDRTWIANDVIYMYVVVFVCVQQFSVIFGCSLCWNCNNCLNFFVYPLRRHNEPSHIHEGDFISTRCFVVNKQHAHIHFVHIIYTHYVGICSLAMKHNIMSK